MCEALGDMGMGTRKWTQVHGCKKATSESLPGDLTCKEFLSLEGLLDHLVI
jgi:hypothetical protein